MSELNARLDLPLGPHAPAAARQAVTGILSGWGLDDPGWLDDAALVVSELVTNAYLHSGGSIELMLQWHDTTVALSAMDGTSVVPRRRSPDDAGGRGLTIIEALTARWGVEDHEGGKRVWVELLPSPARPLERGSARGDQARG